MSLLAGAGWLLAAQAKPARTDLPTGPASIEAGRKAFLANCSGCHGLDGSGGDRGPTISAGSDAARMSDDDLRRTITDGVAGAGMPPFASMGQDQITSVMAYLRDLQGKAGSVALPGNPAQGEKLFFGNAACATCHMAGGRGGFLGSDLTAYGGSHSPEEIRRAITDPVNREEDRSREATVKAKDGQSFTGLVRSEDNFSLSLLTRDGKFIFFQKSQLQDITYNPEPLMPKDYGTKLNKQQLDDLVSYLMELQQKKDPAASQQKVRRNWEEPD